MPRTMHRILGSRRSKLGASLVGVLAAVGTITIPATAAHAASTYPGTGIAHVCKDIGSDSAGVHAIICSDITKAAINGGTRFWPVTEAYCQASGGYQKCLDNVIYASASLVTDVVIPQYGCSGSSCVTGRNYYVGQNLDVPTGQCDDVAAVTWGEPAAGIQSSIDLPGSGGRKKLSGEVEASGTVCG